MAAMTQADLRLRILQNLGRVEIEGTPEASDAEVVDEAIVAAIARLRNFGLIGFDDTAIPEYAQILLRDYVSGDLVTSFGMDEVRRQYFAAKQAKALKEMREQVQADWDSQPVNSVFY